MYRRTTLTTLAVCLVAGCLDDGPSASPDGDDGPADDGDDDGDANDLPAPAVEEPSYEIEEQDYEDDTWNDHHLGEHMADEPSLSFEVLDATAADPPLSASDYEALQEYAVEVVTSPEEEADRLEDDLEVDYEDEVVVLVYSGYGSSSKQHRWRRVEETENGVHLYGYYTVPAVQTEDFGSRSSILRVERPVTDPTVSVSLTVAPDQQVTFDATEDRWGIEDS